MKVQKSRKSGKKLKVKKLDAFGHSNSLKEGNFKSWIDLSFPSKLGAFLCPPNTPHEVEKDHTPDHHNLSLLNLPIQLARSSTTPCGMTAWPNEPQIVNTSYCTNLELPQCRSKWSLVSPFLFHIQNHCTTTTCHLRKLSTIKNFPNTAIQRKKVTFVGTFGFHNGFHGKDGGLVNAL